MPKDAEGKDAKILPAGTPAEGWQAGMTKREHRFSKIA